MPIMLFSGFFSNAGGYPDWIGWVQWISPIRYSLEALIQNEFGNREYGPNDVNLVQFLGFDLGIGSCLAILAGLAVFFRIFAAVCLRLLVTKFQ